MKKILLLLVMVMLVLSMSCELQSINNDGNSNGDLGSGEGAEEATEEAITVAYNFNNVWHEELLTEEWNSNDVDYWNFISEGLRYWDRECTDPIDGNESTAVNSHTGRKRWSYETNSFVPYDDSEFL